PALCQHRTRGACRGLASVSCVSYHTSITPFIPIGKESCDLLLAPHIYTEQYRRSVTRILNRSYTMSKKLADHVAIVTGASKGIGAAVAKHLASEGATVVVNYASSKEGADRVVNEIKNKGGKAIAVQADLAKKPDIDRLFAETKKAFGRLDILVNNAAVYEATPIESVTAEIFHREYDV